MSILNGAIFDNYVSDVAVTMVVGLGYYLFNSLRKKKTSWKDQSKGIKNIKSQLEVALERFQYAKTIEEYNDLIKSDYEKCEDPFLILNEMMKKGIVPNIESYNALLLNALQKENCQSSKLLKEEIMDITGPVTPNEYTLNIFIKGVHVKYMKSLEKNPEKSEILLRKFDEEVNTTIVNLGERGIQIDIICINTIIESLIEQKRMEKTWETYNFYKKIVKPDAYTYTSLLKGIKNMTINAEWLNRAFLILEEAKIGYNLEQSFFNSLLDSCIKHNKTDKAVELFNQMKETSKNNLSEYAYSMLIKVYGKSYKLDKCIEMMNLIKKGGVPSVLTYVCLMNVCLRCRKVEMAEKFLEEMGTYCDTEIYNTIYFNIINGYKQNKCFDKAMKLFEKLNSIENFKIDISIYNAILDCSLQFNKFEKMEQIYTQLKQTLISPDSITYSILLKGYAKQNRKEKAIIIYNLVKSSKLDLDELIYISLMDLFVRSNEEELVNSIYIDMKYKGFEIGVLTYSLIMKLYYNMGNSRKALELLDDMMKKEMILTENIYQMVIELQIKGNHLNRAIALIKNLLLGNILPSNSLLSMIFHSCNEKGKGLEGMEIVMSCLSKKIKIDNMVIDSLIDNVISSNQLQISEKIDILCRFSMLLKELNMQISNLTYDKLSKFLFQNKTLNKLSSFSESSIYSTAPIVNTITPSYSTNRVESVNENTNNSSSLYECFNQKDNYSESRNSFNKKPFSPNFNSQNNMNKENHFKYNNCYQSNCYTENNLNYVDRGYRANSNYSNSNSYYSSNKNTYYYDKNTNYSSPEMDEKNGTMRYKRNDYHYY